MAKAKQTAKKANAKTSRATAAKATPETPAVKDLTVLTETPEVEVPVEFKSMCGFDYDPAQAGSCFKTCQGESPEAFAACTANFKATAKKTTSASKTTRRGKNVYGHLIGCQGALIDDQFTVVGGAHSMKDLMKAAGATQPRVISHLKHLVAVWKVDLRITSDKKYYVEGMKSEKLVGEKTNGVKVQIAA
jgi:hypothetical protein